MHQHRMGLTEKQSFRNVPKALARQQVKHEPAKESQLHSGCIKHASLRELGLLSIQVRRLRVYYCEQNT